MKKYEFIPAWIVAIVLSVLAIHNAWSAEDNGVLAASIVVAAGPTRPNVRTYSGDPNTYVSQGYGAVVGGLLQHQVRSTPFNLGLIVLSNPTIGITFGFIIK